MYHNIIGSANTYYVIRYYHNTMFYKKCVTAAAAVRNSCNGFLGIDPIHDFDRIPLADSTRPGDSQAVIALRETPGIWIWCPPFRIRAL